MDSGVRRLSASPGRTPIALRGHISTRTSSLRLPLRSDILLAKRLMGEAFFAAGACGEASFRGLRDGGASLTLYSESSFSSSVSKCDLLLAPDCELDPALFRPERRAGLAPFSTPRLSSAALFLPNLVAGSCQSPVFLRKTDSLRTAKALGPRCLRNTWPASPPGSRRQHSFKTYGPILLAGFC